MSKEAMEQALEALEAHADIGIKSDKAITSLRQAIAEAEKQEQGEPVSWRVRWPKMGGGHTWIMSDKPLMQEEGFVNEALYTTPQQRKPLTDEEFTTAIEVEGIPVEDVELVWAIKDLVEAAHSIKE